jgi:hypothetical protein
MKHLWMTLGLLLSIGAGAQTLPVQKQNEILDQTGKQIRRSYHQKSYTIDGFSIIGPETAKSFTEFLRFENSKTEEPLTDKQIGSLSKCVLSDGACRVYRAVLDLNYMGGSGTVCHWISLNTKTGKVNQIVQTIYSE